MWIRVRTPWGNLILCVCFDLQKNHCSRAGARPESHRMTDSELVVPTEHRKSKCSPTLCAGCPRSAGNSGQNACVESAETVWDVHPVHPTFPVHWKGRNNLFVKNSRNICPCARSGNRRLESSEGLSWSFILRLQSYRLVHPERVMNLGCHRPAKRCAFRQ